MSDAPVLRAESEAGDVVVDPSEDALLLMLEDIEAGAGTYLIVESLRDPGGQTYAQALRNADGTYDVEYRAGGPEEHHGTVVADVRAAHALLTGWAFDIPGWHGTATWRPVAL